MTCHKWYIEKTFTPFKKKFSNHKSEIEAKIRQGIVDSSSSEGDIHLLNHFAKHHKDMSSLKWTILHQIGKKTIIDPAANLLKWEHAYIDFFNCKYPGGLNVKE